MNGYTQGERIETAAAREMIEGCPQIFYDDLGGGSEAIRAYRLPDGRALVWCTGTGCWIVPADADVERMCIDAARGCYAAAGFASPYEDATDEG